VSVTSVAEGPAMYLGSSIMSFALPIGAFIVIATTLFLLFLARHSLPRLKYLPAGTATSVMTREPGPVPAPAPARDDAIADKPAGSAASAAPEAPASPEEPG
jgi:hypothetical protein